MPTLPCTNSYKSLHRITSNFLADFPIWELNKVARSHPSKKKMARLRLAISYRALQGANLYNRTENAASGRWHASKGSQEVQFFYQSPSLLRYLGLVGCPSRINSEPDTFSASGTLELHVSPNVVCDLWPHKRSATAQWASRSYSSICSTQ